MPRYTMRVHEDSVGPRRYFYDNGAIMLTEDVLAILNAAEDAGRLRAAAQVVIDAADAAWGIWIPLEQPLAALRQALRTPETKEETT